MLSHLPKLIQFYIRQVAIGFALSVVFVTGLLWFDVAGLGGLILGRGVEWIALVMLFLFNGLVFAGAQSSVAVLLMTERGQGGGGGTPDRVARPIEAAALAPVSRD